jgi:uncharacterized membrane protein HdeD (DUF308 family)
MNALVGVPNLLFRNWWVVLLRGLAGIVFGIATMIAPGLSLAAMVLVFGAYAFADGVLLLISAINRRAGQPPAWMLVLEGVTDIGIGVIALFWPGITALGLLWVVAAWALVTGIFEIGAAIRLRKAIKGEWLLALSGVLSIGLGIMLIVFPVAGLLTLVLWIGAYALLFGVVMVLLSLRLRARRGAQTTLNVVSAPPEAAPATHPG